MEHEELNTDNKVLDIYLKQYRVAKRRERELEQRLHNIQADMMRPIGGVNYTPINKPKNEPSMGAASFTFRMSQIETEIQNQREIAAKDMVKIMDMFDYLDSNSEEREALELHYIEGMKWNRVARKMHMDERTVYNRRNSAFDKLLSFERVRNILARFRKDNGF